MASPMLLLILTVCGVVLISALCSTTEAALYSVPWTYIETLRARGNCCSACVPMWISPLPRCSP